MAAPKEIPRYLASFGRRRVRGLKPSEQELFERLLPEITLSLPEKGSIDPAVLFPKAKAVYLEIGFGGGEHLAAQAARRRDEGFIGGEVFLNGIGKFLRQVEGEHLANIRLFTDDIRLLLERLEPESLDGVYLLFPDPWPKARHHKRRLIRPETLALLAAAIRPGGSLRIATDHTEYLRWILAQMLENKAFSWQARAPGDWQAPPDHVTTRYETKARREGRTPVFLEYRRQ